MDTEEHETPQKVIYRRGQKPNTESGQKKTLHPRTPQSSAVVSASCSSFHIFPSAVVSTPPAKRFHRVRNPFEAALAERLHLPLIASPSLFQRSVTPQLSSTQFEWTIDQVSVLKPAHVEPHETQFHDSPNPEYEAMAQTAISSYFKEQQIVPSPVDCPLRSHRIIMAEMNGNTPIAKPGRRIRDVGTQTELTLPSVLPKVLEDALRPYLLPQLSLCDDDNYQTMESRRSSSIAYSSNSDDKDYSLRRKLFGMHNEPSSGGHSNSSPLSLNLLQQQKRQQTAFVGKLSDSLDKSSFGSLSPITCTEDGLSISPHSPQALQGSATKRKSRLHTFQHDQLSPIHPPTRSVLTRHKSFKNTNSPGKYRVEVNTSELTFGELTSGGEPTNGKFTPDRSSSPLNCLENVSDSSFNIKVSGLEVNSKGGNSMTKPKLSAKSVFDVELFLNDDDTVDMLDDIDDDDMQVSQLSVQSSNCSSSNSDTPRRQRRSASRKNLSQSFSQNWIEAAEAEDEEIQEHSVKVSIPKLSEINSKELPTTTNFNVHDVVKKQDKLCGQEQRLTFHRTDTDSGFNEMTTSSSCSSYSVLNHDDHSRSDVKPITTVDYTSEKEKTTLVSQEIDVNMVCCSTPSTRNAKKSAAAS